MWHELNGRILAALSALWAKTSDDDGQTLAEYSLIVTVIAVAVVIIAVIAFRGALVGGFGRATNCLDGSC